MEEISNVSYIFDIHSDFNENWATQGTRRIKLMELLKTRLHSTFIYICVSQSTILSYVCAAESGGKTHKSLCRRKYYKFYDDRYARTNGLSFCSIRKYSDGRARACEYDISDGAAVSVANIIIIFHASGFYFIFYYRLESRLIRTT